MTIHSALRLGGNNQKFSKKSIADLNNIWAGVEYLFIDKVSMISCKFLAEISELLTAAKSNLKPFGGVSVIFARDFSQLPPVAGTPLFHKTEKTSSTSNTSISNQALQKVAGRLLWQGLTHCVLLHQQMRQSGEENNLFRQLLGRVAMNKCVDDDYDT